MHAATKYALNPIDFGWLYKSYEPMVRRIVRGFRLRDATADDLVQEIFIKAWKALPDLRNSGAISPWLKMIARNACLSELREQKRRSSVDRSLALQADLESEPEVYTLGLLQYEQHLAVLETMIREHGHPIRKRVALMFYLEHRSTDEIATMLQMPKNTVLSHLRRFRLIAMSAMREWLQERKH
jgi:RNA polymerase sigma-70 factor (ECF subfamily)